MNFVLLLGGVVLLYCVVSSCVKIRKQLQTKEINRVKMSNL